MPIVRRGIVWGALQTHGTLLRLFPRSVRAPCWAHRARQELHSHRGDIDGDLLGA